MVYQNTPLNMWFGIGYSNWLVIIDGKMLLGLQSVIIFATFEAAAARITTFV